MFNTCRENGYDNHCCYDNDGNLIETNYEKFGGTTQRYHYKGDGKDNIPFLSNFYDDLMPYIYCCQYPESYGFDGTELCQKYLNRRPPSRCDGYIPPRLGK